MASNAESLKRRLLELLRSDWEFRRAVAAELGLLEILERLERLEKRMVEIGERLEEHSRAIRAMQEELRRFGDRLAALGARWGLYAEEAVREALYKLLKEYLGVARVEKWRAYDEAGEVLGRPEFIEIDVVVKDDTHYLVEVKSSVDVYDVYIFNRKCEFYTSKVKPGRTKKLMVTFYADERARRTAEELGIEIVRG